MSVPFPRVLVVDDEPMLVRAMALAFRERFEVVEASGGVAAIAEIERFEHLAVVVTDLDMPEQDGLAVLHAARRRHPTALRILTSGRAHPEEIAPLVAGGLLTAFVPKPWQPSQLRSAVEGLLDRRGTLHVPRPVESAPDDVPLDAATRVVPELLARVRAGDDEATGELIERFQALLLWRIQHVHRVPERDVEDVFQDVCSRLLLARARIHKASGFLCALAMAASIDHHRKRVSEARKLQAFALDQAHQRGPAGSREGPGRHLDLLHVLEASKGRCLELFRDLILGDRTHQEYAAEKGVPRGTLGTTITRCMAKVRKALALELPSAAAGARRRG